MTSALMKSRKNSTGAVWCRVCGCGHSDGCSVQHAGISKHYKQTLSHSLNTERVSPPPPRLWLSEMFHLSKVSACCLLQHRYKVSMLLNTPEDTETSCRLKEVYLTDIWCLLLHSVELTGVVFLSADVFVTNNSKSEWNDHILIKKPVQLKICAGKGR